MPVLFIFTTMIIHNDKIFEVDYIDQSFKNLSLKEEIIDYAMQDLLYALTNHNIYSIDTVNLQILDHTPLPQKFNYITIGQDEIFLISTSEIIILNKSNLAFKAGIGIETEDYLPMIAPVQLPQKNLIYLIANSEKRSIIKIIDRAKGRRVKSSSFVGIKKFYYLPEEKNFIILCQSGLLFLDLNLKIKKSVKFKFPGEGFFFYKDGYIITNPQGICLIDLNGKIIDFQPVVLNRPLQNLGFVFWNSDFIILIDPLTLHIKHILKNIKDIYEIHPLNNEQNICINKNDGLFVMENKTGSIKNLVKKEFARIEMPEIQKISEDSLFYLQFGAFSDNQYAQNFCDSIRKMGLPVFIDSGIDNLYRIKLGGFMEKSLVQEIMENFGISGWLVYHKKIESDVDSLFSFNQNTYYLQKGIIIKKE